MKVLVLGITGMLGHVVFRVLSWSQDIAAYGTVRKEAAKAVFPPSLQAHIIAGMDCDDWEGLASKISTLGPDVIVNCIGVVKQLASSHDPLVTVPINTLLPHRLAALCRANGSRLIHISTDCVFSGSKGMYKETDIADARDLYGLSKFLGEVTTPESITLRTSIIGPELAGNQGLLGWFLSQSGAVNGFARAIFSGLPTVELARVLRDVILPRPAMHGLYHVAASPINKFELLQLFAATYGKNIEIRKDESVVIDRSLDPAKFHAETGYVAPDWPSLIAEMHNSADRFACGTP
jgi:dTDP-4-dehydrorhamnose reductase